MIPNTSTFVKYDKIPKKKKKKTKEIKKKKKKKKKKQKTNGIVYREDK